MGWVCPGMTHGSAIKEGVWRMDVRLRPRSSAGVQNPAEASVRIGSFRRQSGPSLGSWICSVCGVTSAARRHHRSCAGSQHSLKSRCGKTRPFGHGPRQSTRLALARERHGDPLDGSEAWASEGSMQGRMPHHVGLLDDGGETSGTSPKQRPRGMQTLPARLCMISDRAGHHA